mmetsp:Transcript_48912/g.62779  ORF Transcript_48912/g.62779 Transcript_48912/m.62779 type:complete len:503 (+) Transcript_48912:122-1630(+)
MPRLSQSLLLCLSSALICLEIWRQKEKSKIRKLTDVLVEYGVVQVEGSTSKSKENAWNAYLPHLLNTWKIASESTFCLHNRKSWPQIKTGRAYSYAHKSHEHYPIKLWQDHYEAQAVVVCLIDNKLNGNVHWGNKTHWKLKLLLFGSWKRFNPFFKMSSFLKFNKINQRIKNNKYNKNNNIDIDIEIQMEGSENAWGIVNFPLNRHDSLNYKEKKSINKEDKEDNIESRVTPQHAHIDGGRRGLFTQGLPFKPSNTIGNRTTITVDVDTVNVDTALMQLLANQTVIQLFCCSQGTLGIDQGVTGIYEGSHLILSAVLKQVYQKYGRVSWSDFETILKSCTPQPASMETNDVHSNNFKDEKQCKSILSSSSKPSSENKALVGLLKQHPIPENKTVLMLGTCVHGTMFSSQPMISRDGKEYPRVIMNAKSFLNSSFENAESGLCAKLLNDFTASQSLHSSPARQVMLDPKMLWVKSGRSDVEFDQRVEILLEKFHSLLAISQTS